MLLVPELPYVYMRALTLGASWEVLKSSVSNTSMDGVTNNSKKQLLDLRIQTITIVPLSDVS